MKAAGESIVLLYIGLDEISESGGLDHPHMKLPQSQVDLLEAVAAVNPNVVAVMSAGSSVEMPWLDKCKAVIHGYLCGQAGAGAMLQALLGEINPSGKLAESYPLKYENVSSAPYFPAKQRTAEYREGLYVGYRYYETANVPVLFPFGFGLSYTTFQYSDLKVTDRETSFTLKNTGSVDGAEVAQLYIGKLSGNVSVAGTNAPNPYDKKILADYYTGNIQTVPDVEFENLLGHPIPDGSWSGTLTINDALCQIYYTKGGQLSQLPAGVLGHNQSPVLRSR